MDGLSGPWGNARAAIQNPRAGDGRARCSSKRCRLPKRSSRRARGLSRCWAWTRTSKVADATPYISNLRHRLAERLVSSLGSVETPDWVWFEKSLAYENARMPQALIVTGIATSDPSCVAAGLRSLRWLMTLQTTPAGLLSARRFAEFRRRDAPAATLRSTTAGSHRDHFSVPRGLARRSRSQVESRCLAGLQLVSRSQRSFDSAGGC